MAKVLAVSETKSAADDKVEAKTAEKIEKHDLESDVVVETENPLHAKLESEAETKSLKEGKTVPTYENLTCMRTCNILTNRGFKIQFTCCGRQRRLRIDLEFVLGILFLLLVVAAALYFIIQRSTSWNGPIREYYIAVEEVEWDYAPIGRDMCKAGGPFNKNPEILTGGWTTKSNIRIGTKYTKAQFIEYTDLTFSTVKRRAEEWEHLGNLGPLIRGEVGDTIRVHFRNNARFPYTISPLGLPVGKQSEGANYADGARWTENVDNHIGALGVNTFNCGGLDLQTLCQDFEVKVGNSLIVDWTVTEEAAPGPRDGDSVLYLYRSDPQGPDGNAIYSGLFGPILITAKGRSTDKANGDFRPKDVDKEFINLFFVSDENHSPYLQSNIWNKILKPSFGDLPTGWVPFAGVDKAVALQNLYEFASHGSSLKYSLAEEAISNAIQKNGGLIETLQGVKIYVNFGEDFFDPREFDSYHGKHHGSAYDVMRTLLSHRVDTNDVWFRESNKMNVINGYIFCNQPGLDMKVGQKTRWYNAGLGTEGDVHVVHWHGNTGVSQGERTDTVQLLPSVVANVDMVPENPGRWLIHCHVNEHITAGMNSYYNVEGVTSVYDDFDAANPTTRRYYVAAEDVEWDYNPSGMDSCTRKSYTALQKKYFVASGKRRPGKNFTKLRYVEYTDDTFTTRKQRAPEWEHLGLLGPVLEANVGEKIEVVFRNKARVNTTMHPHGVLYTKMNQGVPEGSLSSGGNNVAPGDTYTYEWPVPETAGPGPDDGSSIAWLYHSHMLEVNDTNAGLVGAILVTDPKSNKPKPDREFVVLPTVWDESDSTYAMINLRKEFPHKSDDELLALRRQPAFRKYNAMRGINGMALCTLPGLEMNVGDHVRWHLMSLGAQKDIHSISFEAHAAEHIGHRVSTTELMPATMASVDMHALHSGTWLLADYVWAHYRSGMLAHFVVNGKTEEVKTGHIAQEIFIAADEIEWDYAPHGMNKCTDTPFGDDENIFVEQGVHRIGKTYMKSVYREYLNGDFKRLKSGTQSRYNKGSEHLGLLGPVLRAEPGQSIKITFRNNRRFPASLDLFGPIKPGDVVLPGQTITKIWTIPAEAGPGPGDGDSVAWMYGSMVNPEYDSNSGLLGVLIVNRVGKSKPNGIPSDYDREFVLFNMIIDEGRSMYAQINALKYADEPWSIDYSNAAYKESNKMHSINGYMYCNGDGFSFLMGQKARWYVLAMGSDHDVHSMRWQGNPVQYASAQTSAALVIPMSSVAVDMQANNPGVWKVDCDVVDHRLTGMNILYTVRKHVHQYVNKRGANFVQWSDSALRPAPAPKPTQLDQISSTSSATMVVLVLVGGIVITLVVVFYICTKRAIQER